LRRRPANPKPTELSRFDWNAMHRAGDATVGGVLSLRPARRRPGLRPSDVVSVLGAPGPCAEAVSLVSPTGACQRERPSRPISSASVAPVAAASVTPVCRRSWNVRSGRSAARRAIRNARCNASSDRRCSPVGAGNKRASRLAGT
jgi:hypothetical protein